MATWLAPIAFDASATRSALRSQIDTRPPSATIRRATSRPRPDAPPVTTAVRPAKRPSKIFMSSSSVLAWIGTVQLALRVEPHAEARSIEGGCSYATVDGHWLVEQLRTEHRHHLVGFGSHHQELGERAIVPRDHEMIAVDRRAVRDHQLAVGIRQRRNLQQL